MEYIDIDKTVIPYRFEISLADVFYTFEVHYNAEHDFFTVDLERDGEVLVYGEKLVYGVPLFRAIRDRRFPAWEIVPLDESGNQTEVTWETLGESVFLFVGEAETDA
ncbi:phage baseplate plug family protein [Paenibacillus caseinilyticus]|uniref:phage baseplate plug family protein n=1 Tax=Paenibacillus caseinilyticus TaxID=3098138 RepID=UPI0022B8B030|nr:hypothetical protein [Paenibacillus caseinilyticus]MCZ8518889.1 hypothetical protein [Paenibacillus caseinilyticus]